MHPWTLSRRRTATCKVHAPECCDLKLGQHFRAEARSWRWRSSGLGRGRWRKPLVRLCGGAFAIVLRQGTMPAWSSVWRRRMFLCCCLHQALCLRACRLPPLEVPDPNSALWLCSWQVHSTLTSQVPGYLMRATGWNPQAMHPEYVAEQHPWEP